MKYLIKLTFVIFFLLSILLFIGKSFLINNPIPTSKNFIPPRNLLVKQNTILNHFVESTPFVWNGELKYLVSERSVDGEKDHRLAIYDFTTNKRISSFGEGLGLGSALIYNNVLYVFATKNWGKMGKSEIYLIKSSDILNFSDPISVHKSDLNQSIFNTSVVRNTNDGKFIMAMETDEDGFVAFTIRLLESSDLIHWKQVPNAIFGKDVYAACPAIRFIKNEYYMWFLSEEYNDPNCKKCLTYVEKIARSKDLVNWEISPQRFLVPDKGEGISTSDIDFAEYKDKVYIFYAAGDQATWSNLKYALYNSTMPKLVENFFEK